MRPMLRPGLHIMRRDLRSLQIGLEWPGIAVIQDSESVRAVLDAVDGFRDTTGVVLAAAAQGVSPGRAERALQVLIDVGVLVDQALGRPDRVEEAGWAALWLLAGPAGTADALLASREQARVHVEGTGRVARLIRSFVRQEQVPLISHSQEATLRVLAGDREPSRTRCDEAMRHGVPYLCVGVRELVGLVGPFVVPGRSACHRCVELSRAQVDRCWPTLVDSAAARPAKTASCPASLAAVLAGYAAQEVALWASGLLPVSCDSVVEIPHGLGPVQTVAYPPHPQCGCGWVAQHDTMSA